MWECLSWYNLNCNCWLAVQQQGDLCCSHRTLHVAHIPVRWLTTQIQQCHSIQCNNCVIVLPMITVIATAIGWPDQYVWMAVLAICEDACESPELVLEGGVGHYLSGHLPILLCVLMVPGSAPSLPASDRPKLCHCFGHWTVISRSLSFLIPTTGLFRGCQKCSTFHHLVKVPIGNDRSQHHWMIGNLLKNDQMVHWNFHIQPLQRKLIVCMSNRPQTVHWNFHIQPLQRESVFIVCMSYRPQTVSAFQPSLTELLSPTYWTWFTRQTSEIRSSFLRFDNEIIHELVVIFNCDQIFQTGYEKFVTNVAAFSSRCVSFSEKHSNQFGKVFQVWIKSIFANLVWKYFWVGANGCLRWVQWMAMCMSGAEWMLQCEYRLTKKSCAMKR